MRLKVGIIDDEIHAIETLEYDLKAHFTDTIDITFTTTKPVEGVKLVRNNLPDLLFLDIEMPGLSGIDVLEIIDDLDVQVVITTAHQDFAIDAVGTNAIAYLLKPIQIEQLQEVISNVQKNKDLSGAGNNERLAVPVLDGIEIVKVMDIIYCKSDSNYTTLNFLNGKKLVASKTLKFFTDILPAPQFVRIHKSYLINLYHVKKYLKKDGGEVLMQNDQILPVSRSNRDLLLKLIQNNR